MNLSIEYFPFVKMIGDEEEDNHARLMNNEMLRKGFVGIGVIENATIPEHIKKVIESRLFSDEKIGTVEAYENGGYNIFIRVYNNDKYYLDGFFKVFINGEN